MKTYSKILGVAALGASAFFLAPAPADAAPVRAKAPTVLAPGNIPDGTIYVRDIRGRILFTGPSQKYRFGKQISIQPYDTTDGKLDVTIENANGVVVSQRLRGNRNQYLDVFYNRSLGGFKVRNQGPDFSFLHN